MKFLFALLLNISVAAFAADSAVRSGFKLVKIENGSVYERLGLKEGDILKSYNGKSFKDQRDTEQFAKLISESKAKYLKLVIERAGKIQELKYDFND